MRGTKHLLNFHFQCKLHPKGISGDMGVSATVYQT